MTSAVILIAFLASAGARPPCREEVVCGGVGAAIVSERYPEFRYEGDVDGTSVPTPGDAAEFPDDVPPDDPPELLDITAPELPPFAFRRRPGGRRNRRRPGSPFRCPFHRR